MGFAEAVEQEVIDKPYLPWPETVLHRVMNSLDIMLIEEVFQLSHGGNAIGFKQISEPAVVLRPRTREAARKQHRQNAGESFRGDLDIKIGRASCRERV